MGTESGWATREGTRRYRERFNEAPESHFRTGNEVTMSSIGIGTYLGNADDQTDENYADSVARAVQLGVNVIDSAINYRFQRSERSICKALSRLKQQGFNRDELVVSTKAGFLSFDGTPPEDPRTYILKTYLETGLLGPDDIAAGSHSIAPRYLEDQLNRSLGNLGLETIDIFYVHNPETQLEEIEPGAFLKRLRSAFEFLEFAVATGKIRTYGTATWYAYLGAPKSRSFLSMADIVGCARDIAGDDHHFSVIQMPYNLSMREACATRNQQVDGKSRTPLEAAADLGLTVMASASTFQARLTRDLPPAVSRYLEGLETDSQRAIQFVRSTPGITTALVGMSQERHVEENLRLIGVATASADAIRTLLDAA